MAGTLKKGVLSLLLALAVSVSAFERIDASTAATSIAEEAIAEETETEESGEEGTETEESGEEDTETEESGEEGTESEDTAEEEPQEPELLTAPQNFRYEDGFIKWDKVEEAYGYTLRMHMGEEEYREFTKYFDYDDTEDPAEVELDRFLYDNFIYRGSCIDFGDYRFDVRTFDKEGNHSEWSESIIAKYEAALDVPANVRLCENETIEWDEVEGAVRYYIRIIKCDDENYRLDWIYSCSFYFDDWYDSGDYLISVQAMDKDYNVSEWTEPIMLHHTYKEIVLLDAPKNLRFDESGENILWDEVEGADHYQVQIHISVTDEDGNTFWIYRYDYPEEPRCDNWKTFAVPFSNAEYKFYVYAYAGNINESSDPTDPIYTKYDMTCDESINVPEVRLEDSCLEWDNVEGAKEYWLTLSINGQYIKMNGYDCYRRYDANTDYYDNYLSYDTSQFPIGTYDVNLFVVDEHYNYNKKTFSLTFGQSPDESVWLPKMHYKFEVFLWDYDRFRHDDTRFFWLRIKNAKDDTVVKLQKLYDENWYGFGDLPNGYYIFEVCACEYGRIDEYNYGYKVGAWSKLPNKDGIIEKYNEGGFDEANEVTTEVEVPPEAADVPEEDRIKTITINPAFNMRHKDGDDVELDLSKIEIKASEIYDEEGLKRVEEALGQKIKGNQHYNLLDLTLLYNGEDFSNGYEGLVKVIIPIPQGHLDKNFSCYRIIEVDGKSVKEEIDGEREGDNYIIYLEHFSEYALIGTGEHVCEFGEEWNADEENHWKECECGERTDEDAHTYGEWTVTKEAAENEQGERERSCEVCGYKDTEAIPVLPHTHKYGESYESDEGGHWQVCECGEESEKEAHTFGEWKVTKEATEEEEGEETRKCEICEKTETRAVEKLTPSDSSEEPPVTSDSSEEPVVTTSNPSPSIPSGGSSGNFYVPESTGSGTTTTADVPTEAESVAQLADDNTGAGSDTAAAPADTEKADEASTAPAETPDETAQTADNGTVGAANENGSDKNHNTGVAIAFVPALAAAVGVIVFRKRK